MDDAKKDDQQTFRTTSELKRRLKKVAKLQKRSVAFLCNEYVETGLRKDEAILKRKGKL